VAPSAAETASAWIELAPRAALVWGPLVVAALMLWPVQRTWRAWRQAADRRSVALLVALGCTALFVAAPLLLSADTATSRVRVSPTGVEVTRLGDVRTRLDFADLSRVDVGEDASLGPLTPGRWRSYVRLTGHTSTGERVKVLVTTARVSSLDPLLAALEPVLADRPELSATRGRQG
jgi:hypothetical protein